jgi:DNA-binding GntR family transcriptional regulator
MTRRSSTEPLPTPTYTPIPIGVHPRVIPIQRQTIAGMTIEALRERILRGDYPEGEPLRQDALADELGVSRIPVREALRQLEAEGLVTFNPHRGAVVSSLSLGEIDELFELRADIECDLLRRAIPKMLPEQLSRATDVLDEFEAALRSGEAARWGPLNWHFHAALYAPASRNFTMGVLQKLHQHSDRYFRMQVLLAKGGERANEEHRAIAAAVCKKDIAQACDLMHAHILGAGRSLVVWLEEQRGESRAAASPARR